MSLKNTSFFRIILIILFALSGSSCLLNAINLSYFEEAHFKNGTIGKDNTKLVDAINQNQNAIQRHLRGLKYGTIMNTSDLSQRAILLWAAKYDRLQAINNILTIADNNQLEEDLEASVNYQDLVTGNTPLHQAVINNNLEIVKLLLKNKADQFLVNKIGNTPLHEAVIMKSLPITQQLVEDLKQEHQDEFIEVKNNKQETALDIAPKNSVLEKYLSLIVHPAVEQPKQEANEELKLEPEKKPKIEPGIVIGDNKLEKQLKTLKNALSKLKKKLGTLKNSLNDLKKGLNGGSHLGITPEELAMQKAQQIQLKKASVGSDIEESGAASVVIEKKSKLGDLPKGKPILSSTTKDRPSVLKKRKAPTRRSKNDRQEAKKLSHKKELESQLEQLDKDIRHYEEKKNDLALNKNLFKAKKELLEEQIGTRSGGGYKIITTTHEADEEIEKINETKLFLEEELKSYN